MRRTIQGMAAISLAALVLSGCGAGASSSTAVSPATTAPSDGTYSSAQVHDILSCLRAAGVDHWAQATHGPTPTGPTGVSTPDAGGPVHFPRGLRFTDPKVVKALRVCRITLPSFAPSS
ncbi:MAG: hypothetical protein WB797_06760 [Nocardioides sp.]